jgi:hypothetical protein
MAVFTFSLNFRAQNSFRFKNPIKKHQCLVFKVINNLIIISLEINGRELSFILDSGVSKTILFNITKRDSLCLNDVQKVLLQGLGKGEAVEALISYKNKVSIKSLVSTNETIYVILDDYFDLSSKMGETIHGIIGYDLLKNFIVKINYQSKKIDFYKPENYRYKKCRKCETFPIELYRNKPYINLNVQIDTVGKKLTNVKLLIDSGGSDAIWLFEDSKEDVKTPQLFFNDILGEGLSGTIYGNRSRIPKIKLGSFEIENPTVSFLDSISSKNARNFKARNGSLGGGILKRFTIWLDYPNKQIKLKKNRFFKSSFNYDMSGLDVVYTGKQLVKEVESDFTKYKLAKNNSVTFITNFSYKFKPSYKIKAVTKNSAADKVGIKEGDIILAINRKSAHSYKLSDIVNKLQEKENKKIRIKIKRNGVQMIFEFRLEKKI